MRTGLVVLWLSLCSLTPASAQVSVGIGLPNVSIGINLPVYPQLVPVPGYPVYYAPQVNSNYFFYDGMYWVYQGDNWYASSWYNGPWSLVAPDYVPLYVLRVPVRYYRAPPVYFRGWSYNAPPRWGDHWGYQWQQSHAGWDRWNRSAVPAPAPLPVYQRQYSGNRYPQQQQQITLQSQHYRYQPRDTVVRETYQAHGMQVAPAPSRTHGTQTQPQNYSRPGPPTAQPGTAGPQHAPPARYGEAPQRSAPMSPPPGAPSAQPRQQSMQTPPQGSGALPARQSGMHAPPPAPGGPGAQPQHASPPPHSGGPDKGRGPGPGDERSK